MKKLNYDEIDKLFNKNDLIVSLKDNKTYKYNGFLVIKGTKGYDTVNPNLMVYDNGKLANVIEKGIDHERIEHMKHIENVIQTCKRLGCKPHELLKKDYITELNK